MPAKKVPPAQPPASGKRFEYLHPRADEILERMPSQSLRSICTDEGMPDDRTVLRWVAAHPDFKAQYDLAMQIRGHLDADAVGHIAECVRLPKDHPNYLPPDVARVAMDAKKWEAAKRLPKHYGERVQQEVTGADGSPLFSGIQVSFVRPDPG